MANGHVEIHDLFSNLSGLDGSTDRDLKRDSDTSSMEDTVEYRVMMAYAKRRRPAEDGESKGTTPSQTPVRTEKEVTEGKKKKKKKKGWKRLPSIFRCVLPRTEELQQRAANDHDVYDRCLTNDHKEHEDEVKEADPFGEVASRLTEIADEIPFIPPDIETDSPPDNAVEKMIGLLLRETGDRLNEQELKDANIAAELFWNYGFFKTLISALLMRMGLRSADPEAPGPHASPKTQIAVTCEVTSRLSAVNTLPMNRLLDHGARYLQDYYSSWAQQQGGYEAAFQEDEDEVE